MALEIVARSPLHLREIGVAIDGSLIVPGSMTYPVDQDGHFLSPAADLLRISRTGHLRITRCRAVRDPSGFLLTEEYGSELIVPPSLATIVEQALRLGTKEVLEASVIHQDGVLNNSTSRIRSLAQPLTGWTLRIEEMEGVISVVLSARLHGSIIPQWNLSTRNYWPAEQEASLKVQFDVDPVTRVACFGAYVPSLAKEPGVPAVIPENPGLPRLDVANAPVGTFAQFAVSATRWYSLNENSTEPRYLSITEHGPPTRTPLGLLNDSRSYRWPRLHIYGVDMTTISSMLRGSDDFTLSMTSGTTGDALLSYGSDGAESCKITNMVLNFRINANGLYIDISGNIKTGRLSVSILILWELLILRFPSFTRFIKSFDSRLAN